MYVDPETIPVEEHFPATIFFRNYKKISSPGPVSKNWLGFSYINLEDYELDQNFDETLKKNQTTHPTIKLNILRKYCDH